MQAVCWPVLTALPLGPSTLARWRRAATPRPSCAPSPCSSGPARRAAPRPCRLVPVAVLDGTRIEGTSFRMAASTWPVPSRWRWPARSNTNWSRTASRSASSTSNAGQEQGSWVGYGAWKPTSRSQAQAVNGGTGEDDGQRRRQRPARPAPQAPRRRGIGGKRKSSPGSSGGSGGSSGADAPAPAVDPDRPTLHKKDTSGNSADNKRSRHELYLRSRFRSRSADASQKGFKRQRSSSGNAPASDPDRPVLKKNKKKAGRHQPCGFVAGCHRSRPAPAQARQTHGQWPGCASDPDGASG